MLVLPIKNTKGRDAIVIVLGPDNIDRMKVADPVQIENAGKVLINPKIMVCYEEPGGELTKIVHSGDLAAVLAFLTRGFEFHPEKGDHDRGPQPLRDQN